MGDSAGWVTLLWPGLKYIWENPEKAQEWANRVGSWFTSKNKPGILILGPGGTGKSTLAKLLAGQFDASAEGATSYAESWQVETLQLADDPKVSVVIPPGQSHRRNATWNDLLNDVSAGKYRGVILLSSYGFHSIGKVGYKELSPQSKDPADFLAKYTADKRADEIAVLSRVVPHIAQNRRPMWLLTMVTKEDLWFAERTAVRSHYADGEYGGVLKELIANKDPLTFRHEQVLGCLLTSNFKTGIGEMLQGTSAGYDHAAYGNSFREMIAAVEALMEWELKS